MYDSGGVRCKNQLKSSLVVMKVSGDGGGGDVTAGAFALSLRSTSLLNDTGDDSGGGVDDVVVV